MTPIEPRFHVCNEPLRPAVQVGVHLRAEVGRRAAVQAAVSAVVAPAVVGLVGVGDLLSTE